MIEKAEGFWRAFSLTVLSRRLCRFEVQGFLAVFEGLALDTVMACSESLARR
jgi:hypothetical protein